MSTEPGKQVSTTSGKSKKTVNQNQEKTFLRYMLHLFFLGGYVTKQAFLRKREEIFILTICKYNNLIIISIYPPYPPRYIHPLKVVNVTCNGYINFLGLVTFFSPFSSRNFAQGKKSSPFFIRRDVERIKQQEQSGACSDFDPVFLSIDISPIWAK
ncbi:MAG: hypothetical protein J6T94_01565 [Bacteroidaceae bacterium]|nr:hypothetical protein [Bacteroidaceae bacterium]